jgi:hypothetical protein
LVLPRNKFNEDYIKLSKVNGIEVIRSNRNICFWNNNNRLSPLFRALDTFLLISKALTYTLKKRKQGTLLLLASRFLKSYSEKESFLQKVEIRRINKEMKFAVKNKRIYHLWR